MIPFKRIFALGLLPLAAALFPFAALPQTFPAAPVKIVVGASAGSNPDTLARLVAGKLHERWEVGVIVENRVGANNNIAADAVARAAPDGYTILLGETAIWGINPHLYAKLSYDPVKDFAPVAYAASAALVLAVPSKVPATDLPGFVAYARQNQGKLAYGSAGNGSFHHLYAELLKSLAGLEMLHLPYRGSAPLGLALLSGDVQMGFMSYSIAQQGLKSGQLRILGISTPRRAAAFPDVPSITEYYPDFSVELTLGFVAPAATPREVVAKLHEGITAVLHSPQVVKQLGGLGLALAPKPMSAEQFGALIRAENITYGKIVRLSGARID
jgi:tripartite-type tricarboxylate transporter receptor subunit TctC